MKNIIFLLISFLIISCSNHGTPTNESPTSQAGSPTPPKEVSPTSTISQAPLFSETIYNFPEWMKDLNTPLLAAFLEDQRSNSRKIAFFNANTGEEFDLEMPDNTNGYFWYDAENFGLLSKDLKTAYKFNLLTGKVSLQEVDSRSTRLLDPEWHHGLNILQETNGEYTFDDAWNRVNSKDKNFTSHRKPDRDGIVVTNNLTNEVVWELTAPQDMYITDLLWSPMENNILAYVQGQPDPLAPDFIAKDMRLNIIDVTTGEVQGTYTGDFGRLEWSPDGSMLLNLNARSWYSNYGIGFLDAPCIMFLDSNEKKCLQDIPKHVPPGYELASTGIYKWEPTRESIFFIYLYWSPEKRENAGELCEYSLINNNITCLTENLKELDGRNAGGYSLSPSKEYIYFCISDASILNDYADHSNDGIMKIDGTGYFSWTSIIQDGGPELCTYDELWRPLP